VQSGLRSVSPADGNTLVSYAKMGEREVRMRFDEHM